jgi:glutamine cyclotransferase
MPRKVSLACVLAIAILLLAAPWSSAVTVVNQFPAITGGPPLYFVEGVAYGQGSIYYSNSEALFELNPVTGAVLAQRAVAGYINDLEWVNGELWAARLSPASIVRFDPDTFDELGSFNVSAAGVPEGLAYDGTFALFSVDGPPGMVYELDPFTGTVGAGRPSIAADPEALAYSDGILWEAGKDEGVIHKVNRYTGQPITSFATPTADTHGLGWDGQYLWATAYQTATIYQYDVSDVNVSPTLSWAGPPGYTSDGVDPDSGNSLTMFDFRVKFTDADDEAPWWVVFYVRRDGTWMNGGMPWYMQNLGDTSYHDGAIYSYQMQLPAASTYEYFFYAANYSGEATGPPTAIRTGPIVSDAPPTLAWTGQPGYTTHGVEPDAGPANSALFEFRVLYTGMVVPQYVRLHLLRDGVALPNSPMDMTTTDTTPHDGAIYTFSRAGPPTTSKAGPLVGNRAPVLDWTGATGYEADGVDPDVGSGKQTFKFQVLYTDQDNDQPTSVLLHIARSGQELPTSPLTLSKVPGTRPRQGVVYRGSTSLPRGKTYTHWFEATDGYTAATGPATTPTAGPVVNAPPYLEWVSTGAWADDGVRPDEAIGRTNCEFRVVYRDLDSDAPTLMQLELRRYSNPVPRSPFVMHRRSGTDPRRGMTYARQVWLGPGTYWYRFVASDGFSSARGVPSQWTKGPIIRAPGAAQVTALSALPTAMGAQVSFTLSAPATVQAEILNLAGRPVQALRPRSFEAGVNALVWDGKSAAGLPVPGGVYLVNVVARGEDGAESRALGRVYLQR